MIGTTLGHYRITAKIGEGGMGEVYRANDERLDRDVAIKVLPEAVAEDPQRLARFEREAKLLASLSHQNVATLYGLEEHEEQRFLVMELAEGETLADRIKKGPIVVEDALEIARQIAEGLEAAHECGIIHRDLKPANVMVSHEGKVKVLDFGLAKAWYPDESDADLTHSPTLTGQMTAAGVLLGTAAYMSPEQARGKTADKRADIWAFGVVLFEMLTGTRMFDGETTSDVLAAVLRAEPDWSELPTETPMPVVRLLHRCLERDPRERLHDIADARLEIEEAITRPEWASTDQAGQPGPTFRDGLRAAWPAVLAAVVVTALLATVVWKFFDVAGWCSRRTKVTPGDSSSGRWISSMRHRFRGRKMASIRSSPPTVFGWAFLPTECSKRSRWPVALRRSSLTPPILREPPGTPTGRSFSTANGRTGCGAFPPPVVNPSSLPRRSSKGATGTSFIQKFSPVAGRCCSRPGGE
jgi:serine/threonine protein kinase